MRDQVSHPYIHSFSILSDDRSKAFSKTIPPQCDPEPPPSNESILSCPKGHPVASYVLFLVFLPLSSPPLSFPR